MKPALSALSQVLKKALIIDANLNKHLQYLWLFSLRGVYA